MKTTIKISLLSLVAALYSCKNDDSVDKELKEAAVSMNNMAPQTLSDGIRLDSVSAGHLSLKYNYTLTEDVKENVSEADIKSFKEMAKDEVRKSLQTSSEMEELKKHQVKFNYVYYDKNGKLTTDFSVTPEEYK